MSGEEMGAAIYLAERAPKNREAFAASIILGSVYIGLLLGSIISYIVVTFSNNLFLVKYGWRIPFFLSTPLGISAIVLRNKLSETETFKQLAKTQKIAQSPGKIIIKNHKINVLKKYSYPCFSCRFCIRVSCIFSNLYKYPSFRSQSRINVHSILLLSIAFTLNRYSRAF